MSNNTNTRGQKGRIQFNIKRRDSHVNINKKVEIIRFKEEDPEQDRTVALLPEQGHVDDDSIN